MSVTIGGFPIDVAVSVRRTRKSEVSKYPRERGSVTTDTVKTDEPDLEIEALVSDTPVGSVASHPSRLQDVSPSIACLDIIDRLQEAGEPLVVECSLGRFDQMTITNVAVTRDVKTRKALKFTVSLTRVQIEDLNRIAVSVTSGAGDFGLSIDKLIEGSHLLWRKGDPPGSGPGDDPPGVIVGKEIVNVRGHKVSHDDGRPLSTEEQTNFALDLRRDTQLFQLRAEQRTLNHLQGDFTKRLDNAQKLLDKKNAAAGQHVDPAMFKGR